MSKKLILIIGAPGSGKTTDSEIIAKKHSKHIDNISVGKLIKEEIDNNTTIGKIMKNYVDKGNLIPGDIIMHEVFGKIKNSPNNIVLLDGFARGLNQLKSLGDTLFYNKDIELAIVIEIKISKETSRQRVLGDNPSKDDEELFEHKMYIYESFIKDVEKFYEKDNKLRIIDGEKELDKVVEDIDEILEKKIKIFS